MQSLSDYERAKHFPLNDAPWIFADDLTTEVWELVEAGSELGVSSGLILTAVRTYGVGLVRQALAVASKDMASRAGIH